MRITQKPHSGPRKLVLAFDVGTTYSGVSYCILQPGQIPELRGVTRFPGQERGYGNAKVPSVLYYDDNGNVKAAGSDALTMNVMDRAMDEGWTKAEWWKLHLRPKHLASAHIKEDDIPPLPPGKTAVDVLTDFIKYLFDCTKTYIKEHHIGFNLPSIENSIEFVFSHPNGWESGQQHEYREAIQRAGLVPPTTEGQSRVHMITEGEASLHYCVSSFSEESSNSGPQGIAIIDAGGGTIDLSMYLMTSNPIVCDGIAPAECRLQGSVFVTRRGVDLLKRKLEGSPYCSAEEMEILMREFDQNTKLSIRSADEPVYVKIGALRYSNPQYNIKRGVLKLSGAEAIGLFDESVDAIIDAFERQRKSAKTEINMVFLVGGLGTNEFLWARLQSYFQAQGVQICRPDNDINKAVANGAVLFLINRVANAAPPPPCEQPEPPSPQASHEEIEEPSRYQSSRDAGVSDVVWNQLQEDIKTQNEAQKIAAAEERRLGEELKEAEKRLQAEIAALERAKEIELAKLNVNKVREVGRQLAEIRWRIAKVHRTAAALKKQREVQEMREMLKDLELCPMGYDWIRQSDGYRCTGGSHFITHEQLSTYRLVSKLARSTATGMSTAAQIFAGVSRMMRS